jgi:hypothetical protein
MRVSTDKADLIILKTSALEAIEKITYLALGSVVKGGIDADIKLRILKARIALQLLHTIWTSKVIRKQTKIRIFTSNIKSVLFHGAETSRQNTSRNFVINSCP